jgi:hypothetical protein
MDEDTDAAAKQLAAFVESERVGARIESALKLSGIPKEKVEEIMELIAKGEEVSGEED